MPQTYDDLTRDQLVEILKRRDRERKLGLVWERQEIEADRSINSDFLINELDEALSLGGAGRANFIVEADNYDALRWLRTTHRGAIKFIYIDPPYNSGKTAGKTFVYNDNYVDPNDDYRHSKWLEFMYQRLCLARDLMTPDGLIFVSIDDGEMARLQLLMEIIFPGNFQACLVWQTDGNSDNTAAFKVQHEYILVYSRDKTQVLPPPVIDPNIDPDASKLFNNEIRNTFVKNEARKNKPSTLTLPAGFPASFERGVIPPRSGNQYPNHAEPIIVEDFKVQKSVELYSGWQSKNLFLRFVAQEFAPVFDQEQRLTAFELDKNGAIQSFKPRAESQSHVISVIKNVGSVQKTKSDLKKIGITFDYPKPVGLIQYLLKMMPGNDFTVLDFFAGTGTTAEAVERLNQEDGGTRRWIMVSSTEATATEPDKNVCRDACARRLRLFYETQGMGIRSSRPESYGFSYDRIRRVRHSDVDEALQPDNAWRWVQYAHGIPPTSYDSNSAVQQAESANVLVFYVDRATPNAITETAKRLNGKPAVVYSWTPGRFAEIAAEKNIDLRPIPAFFADRLSR